MTAAPSSSWNADERRWPPMNADKAMQGFRAHRDDGSTGSPKKSAFIRFYRRSSAFPALVF